ncbi:MAG: helix-turn-helix transcriptional regulator [Geminicoccaceae bacterium]
MMMSELAEFSDLIGDIYDCALDTGRWPAVLARIRRELDFANAAIYVFDPAESRLLFYVSDGIAREWEARMPEYQSDVGEMMASTGDLLAQDIDRYYIASRDVPADVLNTNRYIVEWARPQGLCDLLQATLMKNDRRLASLAMGRAESAGRVDGGAIARLRLLLPHVRRAVAISDLIDRHMIETGRFAEALGGLSVPIFLVAENGEVLFRNAAGTRLVARNDMIAERHGCLVVRSADAQSRFSRALAAAFLDDVAGDATGTGIALRSGDSAPAVMHLLPLMHGVARLNIAPRPAVALFFSGPDMAPAPDLAGVAGSFGLTKGEVRLLERIVLGDDIGQAAENLGIARTTAKTHLARMFDKTGTNRQSALVALAHRLSSAPIVGSHPQG